MGAELRWAAGGAGRKLGEGEVRTGVVVPAFPWSCGMPGEAMSLTPALMGQPKGSLSESIVSCDVLIPAKHIIFPPLKIHHPNISGGETEGSDRLEN